MEKILSAKNILITGGTSRLGDAFVRKALERGARVFLTYHQNEKRVEELRALGAECFKLDLSDVAAMELFCKAVKEKTPVLDVIIHNAAAVRDHTLQNLTEEDWDYVLAVDLKAPYFLTKKLLPLLFKGNSSRSLGATAEKLAVGRAGPKIFFITSRAAITGGIGISNYAAAKAGLIGLAKSLAQELGKKNILVNAVNPGFMISGMTEHLAEEVLARNRFASPVERFSVPEEVADFLVYLSSDAMSQVTGQVIHYESRKI